MNENKTNINWYPGHMAKTKKQIKESLDMVDIIYEVIDARIPVSSKIKDIDDIIKDKPKILIMTKYDLCDKKKIDDFKNYYEKIGYNVILVDLISGYNVDKIAIKTEEILKNINDIRINKGLKRRSYKAMVIGIPNVGKSTLINKLSKTKKVEVQNKPGVTKHLSWIKVNEKLEIIDTPGILWPKLDDNKIAYNLASFSAIKNEILPIGKVACYILNYMYNNYKDNLKERYGISFFDIDDVILTYEEIGKKRGCIISGGQIDYDKVSLLIIDDLKNGRLGNVIFDEV